MQLRFPYRWVVSTRKVPSLHHINHGRPRSVLADLSTILLTRVALGILLGEGSDCGYLGDDDFGDFGGFDDFDF